MKRRNAECGKLRRPLKRNKITEGIYGSTLLYLKFLILWALVLLADFILEFRFEFLWPFWLLLRSVYDSFKYQGLAFSVFFVCIALTSDMVCFFFVPVHWLFFAASTYVWVQYVWHTEKGICLPTVILWLLFVYIEAAVRLRDLRHMPFHLDLCRPFAAHCIGYPVVTLGFGFKSYVGYRMRQRKQKDVAKENEFYMQLLQQALPLHQQCPNTSPQKSRGGGSPGESAVSNGGVAHSGSSAQQVLSNKINHRKSLDKGERETDSKSCSSEKAARFSHSNGVIHSELEFIERVGRKVQDAFLAVVVKPKVSHSSAASTPAASTPAASTPAAAAPAAASTANGRAGAPASGAGAGRRGASSVNDFDSSLTEVEKVDKSCKGSVAAIAKTASSASTGASGKWGNHQPKNAADSNNINNNITSNNNTSNNNSSSSNNNNNNNNNNSSNNSSSSSVQRERKNKANRENTNAESHKDDYSVRLEADVKRLKVDLQASRQQEQDLRSQMGLLLSGEKSVRGELQQLRQDNDELQSKLHGLVTARQLDRQALTQLERRLQDERRGRAACEAQLAAERKAKKAEEAAAARAVAMAHAQANKQECTESCKVRRRELEAESKQLRRESKLKDDRILAAEREIQSLRQYKESHNDSEILMSALSAMQDKNAHLENSLSAETRIKLDLFSALGEAKRQLEIRESIIRAQEKEIAELKGKIAQVLAVMPPDAMAFGPAPSPSSKLLLPCPGCTTGSSLDPNATAYTPKGVGIGGLVASTEA